MSREVQEGPGRFKEVQRGFCVCRQMIPFFRIFCIFSEDPISCRSCAVQCMSLCFCHANLFCISPVGVAGFYRLRSVFDFFHPSPDRTNSFAIFIHASSVIHSLSGSVSSCRGSRLPRASSSGPDESTSGAGPSLSSSSSSPSSPCRGSQPCCSPFLGD